MNWFKRSEKLINNMLSIINYIGRKVKANPFPSALIAVFILLTAFGISGSSMGAYDSIFLGKSPGVLLGTPRPIRSDEWLVQSQETLIQKAAGYPTVNKNIGLGQDMSIIIDVPSNSWFSAFKPQNLFFFVMPYSNAFAAKWWFMALVMVLGFYFLMDSLFPHKRLVISLASLILLFNPFVQWWYLPGTMLTIGYSLWAFLMLIKIFEKTNNIKSLAFYSGGLAYATICFIFLLYPPFQLSVAYVVVGLLAGWLYYRYARQRVNLRSDLTHWLAVAAAAVVTIIITGIFLITHEQIINDVVHTTYPGVRSIVSSQNGDELHGSDLNMLDTFSAPILFNTQNEAKDGTFYTNQSEASRIVVINLLLLPVFLLSVLRKPRKDRLLADYLLLSTSVVAGIFMIRMFTPFFNLLFKLLLFDKVQNERLAIGLVLLCVLQLVLFAVISFKKLSFKYVVVVALAVFSLFFDASIMMAHQYPKFVSLGAVLAACLIIGLAAFWMLQKKYFVLGMSLFLAFNMASSLFINPLYNRSEPVTLQSTAEHISSRYVDHKSWIVMGSVVLENIPAIAGEHSLSGVQTYPQFSLWGSLGAPKNETSAYNRYAHVVFSASSAFTQPTFFNPSPDVLIVRFDCDIAKKLPNFGYALSPSPITDPGALSCLKLDDTIKYPNITLNIYKYIPAQ